MQASLPVPPPSVSAPPAPPCRRSSPPSPIGAVPALVPESRWAAAWPVPVSANTGRASGVQFFATVSVTLTERKTGKVLYENPALQVRERYEISVQPELYFDESDAALERVSRQLARRVVSAILEGF